MQREVAHRLAVLLLGGLATALYPLPALGQNDLSAESVQAVEDVFADIDGAGPGCAVGVVADQNLTYAGGFGLANLDYGIPITPRSNFYLGSVGKQFTAAAVVHAVRGGHLSLDDPIQRWVPEVPEYDRPVTVRNLIHHTSGLRDYLGLWDLSGRRLADVHTEEEVLALIGRQLEPNFPAGDEYLYSNTGYFLLSVIVDRATGKSLRAYATTELLEPLGMTRTRIHDNHLEVMDGRAVAYEATGGEYRLAHPWNFDKVGSGGVYSSIEDLVHWDRNYYTEEVGGPGFTEQLRERGVLSNGSTIPYAFGLRHGEYRGLATVGHGGSLAGFRAHLLRFPEERTTVIVLCNFPTSNPERRAQRVADVILEGRLEEGIETEERTRAPDTAVAESLTPEQLDAFVGHWRASMGIEVEIQRVDDRLVFIQDGRRSPLIVLEENVLRLELADITMTVSDPVEGKFHFMSVIQRGQEFTAERFEPAGGILDIAPLIGAYYSEELDVTYRLVDSDPGMMLELPPDRRTRAFLGDDDRIRARTLILEVRRQDGQVLGFTINAGRVRGIFFERLPEG
jgi:CubicO group peptidase (beta-lactamase class C family)